jgi:hypothetical protein
MAEVLFKNLDDSKISWWHSKVFLVCALGFFTDSYNLYSIAFCTNLLGRIYYQDSPYTTLTTVLPGKLPLQEFCAIVSVGN